MTPELTLSDTLADAYDLAMYYGVDCIIDADARAVIVKPAQSEEEEL